MLIDYVVGGLQVLLIGLIVFGGVLCAKEGASSEEDADAQSAPPTDRRLTSTDRTPTLDRRAPM